MSNHCRACDAPFTPHIDPETGREEDMCPTCIRAAFTNMPQDYYEGLWWDRNGHPKHIVISPIILELEEARNERMAKHAEYRASLSKSGTAG